MFGLLIILFDGYTISGIDSQAMFFYTYLTFTSLHIFMKRDIVIPISAGQSLPGSYDRGPTERSTLPGILHLWFFL